MVETKLPVNITEKALSEIKNIISKKNIPENYGLRIGIKGAGCVGISYLLGFDKKKAADDAFRYEGLDIFIQKKDMLYLAGLNLDFYDETETRGFKFISPSSLPQEKS